MIVVQLIPWIPGRNWGEKAEREKEQNAMDLKTHWEVPCGKHGRSLLFEGVGFVAFLKLGKMSETESTHR